MGIYANNAFATAVKINQPVIPSGILSINGTGFYNIYSYSSINVDIIDPLDQIITGDLSTYLDYTDLNASKIADFAFYSAKLANINMPNVTSIGSSAFYNISFNSDIKFNFPKVTYIGQSAFAYLASNNTTPSNYIEINFNSELSSIGSDCFSCNCYISKISLYCSSIPGDAFYRCKNLLSVNLPYCSALTATQAFGYCVNLINVSIPRCTRLDNYTFQGCSKLSTISLPACSSIGGYAFRNCYSLLSVYLNVSSVPSLAGIACFQSTPISNYTTSTGGVYGSIFVPTSLYSSFISATNWATYSSRIVSMNF